MVKEQRIAADHILREEAEMIFLQELSQSQLGARIVFYGGTALRLAYGSPRFSEDIDLLAVKPLGTSLKQLLEQITKHNPNWKLKDFKNKRQTDFALLLISDDKLKHNFSLKIEIHKPEKKVKVESRLALIKSPVSIFEPLVLVPSLSQLKELKIAALMDREKARDIFDLWYISQSLRQEFVLPHPMPGYSEREFKNELQKFLPQKYYPIILELYGKINQKN